MSAPPWMLSDSNLETDNDLWSTVVLGTVVLPGLAKVEVTKGAALKLDTRAGKGRVSPRLRDQGREPVEATVTLRIWEEEHWREWHRHSQALADRIRSGMNRTAMTIAHPVLDALRVTAVCVQEVGGLQEVDTGIWSVDIKVVEFAVPSNASASRTVQPPWRVSPTNTVRDQRSAAANPYAGASVRLEALTPAQRVAAAINSPGTVLRAARDMNP